MKGDGLKRNYLEVKEGKEGEEERQTGQEVGERLIMKIKGRWEKIERERRCRKRVR